METKYFVNYYKAQEYAKKHGLVECEYGDTGYKLDGYGVSYVAFNKSGNRFDDWEVECDYTWEKNTEGRLKPAINKDEAMKDWAKHTHGITEIVED